MAAPPPPLAKPIADLPVHFALLLFPSFQALDVFGPLDALNTIKRQYPSLPLRLSILSSTLSPVSTYPTPGGTDTTSGDHCDYDPETIIPFEQKIIPTHTYTSPPTQPIDIIFIPGGMGTRLGPSDEPGWKPLVQFLNTFFSSHSSVKQLKGIFTVCTGSLLLARSKLSNGKGVLDGIKATTNKRGFLRAKEELKDVLWEPKARWVRTQLPLPINEGGEGKVHEVKLWTTSGVSAGTDGIFALISEEYGLAVADLMAAVLEYERKKDPDDDPFAVQL